MLDPFIYTWNHHLLVTSAKYCLLSFVSFCLNDKPPKTLIFTYSGFSVEEIKFLSLTFLLRNFGRLAVGEQELVDLGLKWGWWGRWRIGLWRILSALIHGCGFFGVEQARDLVTGFWRRGRSCCCFQISLFGAVCLLFLELNFLFHSLLFHWSKNNIMYQTH